VRVQHTVYTNNIWRRRKKEGIRRAEACGEKQRLKAEAEKKKEELKKREEVKKELNKLREEEKLVVKSEAEQRNLLSSSVTLLHEAEKKLSDAIKSGSLDSISIAHGLLEVARKRMDEANRELACLATNDKHVKRSKSGIWTVIYLEPMQRNLSRALLDYSVLTIEYE
jgi:5-methylthioribose kinase